MKKVLIFSLLVSVITMLTACGNSEKEEKQQVKLGDYGKTETKAVPKEEKKGAAIDLSNKGIGPVKSITIPETIDAGMATTGEDVFNRMCTACHKIDKKFIGPAIKGVTTRRAPEWIMNMILNPEEMIANDPIAKQLLVESNMAVMANQNLTEEEARAVLEYFRKTDQ